MLETSRVKSRSCRHSVVVLIAVFKLLKGTALMTVGLGLPHVSHDGLSRALVQWAHVRHVDPEGRHFGRAIQAIATLNGRRLEAVSAGMVVCATLFLTEGIGLLMCRRWAEYFTIVVTASFVPFEVAEFLRRPDGFPALGRSFEPHPQQVR